MGSLLICEFFAHILAGFSQENLIVCCENLIKMF